MMDADSEIAGAIAALDQLLDAQSAFAQTVAQRIKELDAAVVNLIERVSALEAARA